MKNTILKYENEEVEIDLGFGERTYKVQDYFSKDINIVDIIDKLEPFLALYQCHNGDKLERISYELYNTTDYWDILLLLNQRTPLFDMSYDDSIITTLTEQFIRRYQIFIYSDAPLIQRVADTLFEQYLDEAIEENERLRNIIIVKPQEINNFISVLRENNYI